MQKALEQTLQVLTQKSRILCIFLAVFWLSGCDLIGEDTDQYVLRGRTMGTTYTIKALHARGKVDQEALYNDIKATLDDASDKFSNWQDESEISQFNNSSSTNWLSVSAPFFEVLQESQRIHHQSGGRFDITLSPLIDIWGFGPNDDDKLPSEIEISSAMAHVGQSDLLEIKDNPPSIRKKRGPVSISLSAIAKGYGADLIARSLEKHGITNYLVEIGGDLLARGVSERGTPWRIGIEKPDVGGRSVQLVISVRDMGMATSGDYRNFIEADGKRLSHILDPVTGRPVTHNLTSVTVLAQTGMRADGLATALLVLGLADGLALAEELKIPAYFITREGDGFATKSSSAFDALMDKK